VRVVPEASSGQLELLQQVEAQGRLPVDGGSF
jgi:hypothetical protein